MIQETETDQLIERYLLGDLPQLEREQVETRYFAEPDFLERVDAAEGDLIENYVLGTLSQEKRRRVEENLLRSPYQWEKVRFVETLLHSVDEIDSVADNTVIVSPPHTGWWEATLNFFRLRSGWALAASAALLLLAGALVVEIVRLRQQLGRARKEQIAMQQQLQTRENTIAEQRNRIEQLTGQPPLLVPDRKDEQENEGTSAPSKPQFATFVSPLLFSGGRSADNSGTNPIPELSISRTVQTVRLRLVYDGRPYPRFRAALGDGGDTIFWQGGEWTARKFGRRREIDVDIPAKFFEERIYTLSLKARTSSGEESVSLYTFQVIRK